MSFVLDSSVALAWAFPDEWTSATQGLYVRAASETIFTSPVWPYEVANKLDRGERRGRLSASELALALRALSLLDIRVEPPATAGELDALVRSARLHNLTAYDASFLKIAQARAIPLATLDEALARAATGLGISLLL